VRCAVAVRPSVRLLPTIGAFDVVTAVVLPPPGIPLGDAGHGAPVLAAT